MKTNKKMSMAMAIVCCAAGLLAPAKADSPSEVCKKYGLLEIYDPDGERDRGIMAEINSGTMTTIMQSNALIEQGKKEMLGVQNMPVASFNQSMPVVSFNQNMPVASFNQSMPVVPFGQNGAVVPFSQNVPVVLFNNTTLTICGVLIAPCVNHGAAMPQVLSGWLAPMSGVHTVIGAANAHYNIRFLTNGGVPIDFCGVFIGDGMSRIVLTHVGQGRYLLNRM